MLCCIDDETIFNYAYNDVAPETQELLKEIWSEDFEPIATAFLQKVKAHRSELEPLD